jgi:hypothetical protein
LVKQVDAARRAVRWHVQDDAAIRPYSVVPGFTDT